MRHTKWISAHEIDLWANTTDARTRLPELIRRLVHATIEPADIEHINFPGGEETQRPGYDGETKVKRGNAKVPLGITYWEMGANVAVRSKFEGDYQKRLAKRPQGDYSQIAYVAVTPRDYQNKDDWVKETEKRREWREVHVYDSNDLEQWLEMAPGVALWALPFISKRPATGIHDLSTHWANLQANLKRPLPPDVLLISRDATKAALERWLAATPAALTVHGQTLQEVIDVFAAWVQSLPANHQDAVASRTIVVEDANAWVALTDSKQRLILVCSEHLQLPADRIAEATRKGHHVLRPVSTLGAQAAGVVLLERIDRGELAKWLVKCALSEAEAYPLAQNSGGSFSVFRRQFSTVAVDQAPAWGDGDAARSLAPLLLVGAWDDTNADDQETVVSVTQRPYADSRALATHWRDKLDAPLRWSNGIWEFVSLIDAWMFLHPSLQPAQLDSLEKAAEKVLCTEDPRYDVPADERWRAVNLDGKKAQYSAQLREALARSLAFLGTREGANRLTDTLPLQTRVDRVVRAILAKNASWKRWASLGSLLPLLAEAAPDVVIDAIEAGVSGPEPELAKLFAEERGGFGGRAEHTGLLWALERLGWSKKHLPRVSLVLARLAELDPGGQWANRPKASLHDLFFSWMPHTSASLDDRIGVLKLLLKRHNRVAWELLLSLLPQSHETIMEHRTPDWRFWAEGWQRRIKHSAYEETIAAYVHLAIAELSRTPEKWPSIIEHFPALGLAGVEKFVALLESIKPADLSAVDGKALWNALREFVRQHTYFSDADWALPQEIVARFKAVCDAFAPLEAVELAVPLFSQGFDPIGTQELSWEEQEKLRAQRRVAAVHSVLTAQGFPGILALAEKVEDAWSLGFAVASATGKTHEQSVIPALLTSENNAVAIFATAFTERRIREDVDSARKRSFDGWSVQQIAAYISLLPFERATWDYLRGLDEDPAAEYWKHTRGWDPHLPGADVEFAARQFLNVGRVSAALNLMGLTRDNVGKLKPSLLLELMELLVRTKRTDRPNQMEPYHIQELLKDLQEAEDADESRLASLEWALLPLLDRHSRLPHTLHKILSREPAFFVEVLCALYKPHNEPKETRPKPNEQAKQKAKHAWQLLHDWRRVPGTQKDGTISVEELREWVLKARELARNADRLEVADITIGGVFAHAPADVDETWPCIAVRDVMEETESKQIESGFSTGVYNKRGVYSKSMTEGGRQEREFAAKYRGYADRIFTTHPKVAKVLEGIASSYEWDARREDREADAERS